MKNQIEIKLINKYEEFEDLRDRWNQLLAQSANNDVFLTWEWLFSWWKVFNTGKQLWLVTAWKPEQLVGIAPLMLEKRGKLKLGAKILCSLGTPMNDVGGFILQDQDTQILEALINFIMEHKKKWDILEFTEFLVEGPEIEAIKAVFDKPGFSQIEKDREHYFVPVHESWNDYYDGLSKKFRKNLRRAERNANALGTVTIQNYSGERLSREHYESIVAINQHANYPRLYNSNSEQNFLKELLSQTSQWLNIYFLYINENPIAYEYGFLYNNWFEDWRAGFDTRIDPNISIGKLLSLNVMKNCFERGCETIDFMRGAHAYKTEWEPQTRHYKELRIFKRQSILAAIAYFWLRKLKPVLKYLWG